MSEKITKKRKICPTELDMSDKKVTKSKICPTELDVSDKNDKKTQYVRQIKMY